MTRSPIVFVGLVTLAGLKLLGDALSHWLAVSVPGSFWGFLVLWLVLSGSRHLPKSLSAAADGLLNHLTLFLLPSLVAAAVGLKLMADATVLLLVSGLLVTVVMAVMGGLVMSALKVQEGDTDGV